MASVVGSVIGILYTFLALVGQFFYPLTRFTAIKLSTQEAVGENPPPVRGSPN